MTLVTLRAEPAAAGRVEVWLLGDNGTSGALDLTGGAVLLDRVVRTQLDANGEATVELIPTAELTPAGTVYRADFSAGGVKESLVFGGFTGLGPVEATDYVVDPPGALASPALSTHIAAADPHAGYRLESVPITAADVAADVATQAELDALSTTYVPQSHLVAIDAHHDVLEPETRPQRLLPLPRVMASPPTVTLGLGGAASSITGSTVVAPTDARFRYFGCAASYYPGQTLSYSSRNASLASSGGAGISYSQGAWGVEFHCDAASLELALVVNTSGIETFRIQIDGEWVNQAMTANFPASGTGNNFVLIANGSRRMRHYRVHFAENTKFRGLSMNHTLDRFWRPRAPIGPRCLIVGDSFTQGAHGVAFLPNSPQGYAQMISDRLGWWVRTAGVSGTGYLAPVKYRDRVAQDIDALDVTWDWDYIIVAGGVNDSAFTDVQLGAEVPLLHAAIRATTRGDTSRIVVVLPVNFRNSQQLTSAKVTAIRNAWTATADTALIIDPFYDPSGAWFNGSGKEGAPAGNGNADYYTSTDNLHPSSSSSYSGGHDYFGDRVAAVISQNMPLPLPV